MHKSLGVRCARRRYRRRRRRRYGTDVVDEFFLGTKRKRKQEKKKQKKGRRGVLFFQPMVGVVMVVDFLLIPIAEGVVLMTSLEAEMFREEADDFFFRIPRRDSRGYSHLSCRR